MKQQENILEETEQDQQEISNAALFIKVGIIVLSIIMIFGLGSMILPDAITVSNFSSQINLPIYCVDCEEQKVALSFDVAWENKNTQVILNILKKNNIKATFFMTGEWVNKYPEDVKAIAEAGHDLGNHSENHKQMSKLTMEQCSEEIMKLHKRVKELTGVEMNLFRAPFGDYNNTLVGTARECGYYTIQWDVDSEDWKDYGVDSIIDMTVDNQTLGNGSILLLHVGTKYTAEALEKIITSLEEKGYEIVPVSKLIYAGDYKVDQTGRQFTR